MSIDKSLVLMKELATANNLSTPYIVGGVPRNDLLEGTHEIHDIDITTGDESVHELAKSFADEIGKEPLKHKDHFSVTHNEVRFDFSKNFKYPGIDALLSEKGVKNITDLHKDVYSRDFYINTLLKSISTGEIIDLTGRGKKDIEEKILDCPLDCDLSFQQSPDRMLRAFYFKVNYGFSFSKAVDIAIRKNINFLVNVNPRHAKEMVNKIVREDPEILEELIDYKVLSYVPLTKYLTKILLDRKKLLDVMDSQADDGLFVIRENLDYMENDADDSNVVNPIDTSSFCDKEKNNDYWEDMGDSEAAKDFQDYAKEVKCKSLPVLNKESEIRSPGVRNCPFGLPISHACKAVGNAVDGMTVLGDVPEDQRDKYKKANRRVYMYEQAGERCPYADKIVEGQDTVNCDWGDTGAGIPDFPMRANPYYPKIYRGLGLYSYPLGGYSDFPGTQHLFTGLYSLYASEKDVSISKLALNLKNEDTD